MVTTLKRRLKALEMTIGPPDVGILPTEIWLVAAGDPDNRILLWRAVHATSKKDKDAAVTDLAGRLHTSFEETEASVDQFIEIR